MPYFDVCPQCGSEDVEGNRKRGVAKCLECNFSGVSEEIAVHYTPALNPKVLDLLDCRAFAYSSDSIPEIGRDS
jgi:hypothetical protein